MFFNVDILYRNGPLALVWLAGNGDSLMKSARSKYKTDILKADLHRIIELIFEQLPSVGCDKGMSLKKIVCLYHGVVVIHHMQLEASIKRLSQLYFEACKLRDLDDCNEIDVAPLDHKDLNCQKPKMPVSTEARLLNASLINVEESYSPRKVPQLESERFETFQDFDFDAVMLNRSPRRNRGEKRKEENENEIENHCKFPRLDTSGAEFVTMLEENVTNLRDVNVVENEERFEDWDMAFDGELLIPRQDNVNEVVAETTAADLNDLQFEDEQNVYISPENRRPTVESNQLPLPPLQPEPPVSPIDRRRPRRLFFNAETTINEDVWRNQVQAALGTGDFNARFADLQSRASLLHAVPKTQYRKTVKGLKFILGSGRNLIGFQLHELNSTIVKNLDNSLSHSRLRGDNTTSNSRVDSRILEATHAAVSVEISREDEIGDYPPLNNEEFGDPELMETSAGLNRAEIEHHDENENYDQIPNLSPIIRRLRRPTSPLPPATTIKVGACNVVNEDTIIGFLKTGEKIFSDIFPTTSTTRLQAAQGMMLLLRMKNDRKIEMLQTENNGSVMYGVITIRLIERKRRSVTD